MNTQKATTATATVETLRSHAPMRDPQSLLPVAHPCVITAEPGLDAAVEEAIQAIKSGDPKAQSAAVLKVTYELANSASQRAEVEKDKLSTYQADLESKYSVTKEPLMARKATLTAAFDANLTSEETIVGAILEPLQVALQADREKRLEYSDKVREAHHQALLKTETVQNDSQNSLEQAQDLQAKKRGEAGLGLGENPTAVSEATRLGIGFTVDGLADQPVNTGLFYSAKVGAGVFTFANIILLFAEGKPEYIASLHPILWGSAAGIAVALAAGSQFVTDNAQVSASQIQRYDVMQRINKKETPVGTWRLTPNLAAAFGYSATLVVLEASVGYLGIGSLLQNQDAVCSLNPDSCNKIPAIFIIGISALVGSVLAGSSYSYGKIKGINHANQAARAFLEHQYIQQLQAEPLRQAVIEADIAVEYARQNQANRRADLDQLLERLQANLLNLAADLEAEQTALERLAIPTRARLASERDRLNKVIESIKTDLELLQQAHAGSLAVLEAHVEAVMNTAESYAQKLERCLSGDIQTFTPSHNERPSVPQKVKRGFWAWLVENVLRRNKPTKQISGGRA